MRLAALLAGPLLAQPLLEVERQVHNLAFSHFLFAKALVPLLRDSPESSLVLITGGAGAPAPASICRLCTLCRLHCARPSHA